MPDTEKHYTDFQIDFDIIDWEGDPQTASNLHIWLPTDVFAKIDEAIKSVPSIRTREDFAVAAIRWAVESIELHVASTLTGLTEASDQPR